MREREKKRKKNKERKIEKDRPYAYVSAARWPVQSAWALLASLSKRSNYNVLHKSARANRESSRLSSSQSTALEVSSVT